MKKKGMTLLPTQCILQIWRQRLLALCWPEKMLQGKRFSSSEEVIAEAEAYFESRDESFYKKGIEEFEKRWSEYITREGNYVDE